jgi:hypothetical protein
VDNTLFCDECGTYLLEEEGRDTFQLEDKQHNLAEEATQSSAAAIDPDFSSSFPSVIQLKIANTHRKLEVKLEKILYLGRLDPVANIYPEIDLTNDNGLEFGVSRQHLRVLRRIEGIFIEDLGSINGSFINGQKLAPYQPEPLLDGDIIRLGRLDVEVSFNLQ